MNKSWNELQQLWNSQPDAPAQSARELRLLVERRSRELERTVHWRGWRETIAGIGLALWVALTFRSDAFWLIRAGHVVVGLSALAIVAYLRLYRRAGTRPDPDQPLAAHLRALQTGYARQIRLLKTVKYWYLLPLYSGGMLLSSGMLLQCLRRGQVHAIDIGVPVLITLCFGFVWWLNEVKAVGVLERKRNELLALLPPLESDKKSS